MKRVVCVCALLLMSASANASDVSWAHRRLHLEQQQDALNLDLQQNLSARRFDLDPAYERRLEALQLRQRMEYHELEQHQLQRDHLMRRDPLRPDDERERRLKSQRESYALERQLQLQRFELDSQRLLQSAPRRPLQPPVGASQLRLP